MYALGINCTHISNAVKHRGDEQVETVLKANETAALVWLWHADANGDPNK